MEYIKKLITSVDFILSMFVLIGLRSVFVGLTVGDAIAFCSISALIGGIKYIEFKKAPDITVEIRQQLSEMRSQVSAMALKNGVKEVPNVRELPKDGKRWF